MSTPRMKSYFSLIAAVLMLGQVATAQAENLPDFTGLVEQASPAVVNISTRQKLPDRAVANKQMPDLEACRRCCANFSSAACHQVRAHQEPARVIASARLSRWGRALSSRPMAMC